MVLCVLCVIGFQSPVCLHLLSSLSYTLLIPQENVSIKLLGAVTVQHPGTRPRSTALWLVESYGRRANRTYVLMVGETCVPKGNPHSYMENMQTPHIERARTSRGLEPRTFYCIWQAAVLTTVPPCCNNSEHSNQHSTVINLNQTTHCYILIHLAVLFLQLLQVQVS